ncbi:MAG: cysteine desulfurase [Candidatus Paceibacterota bacterium]
MKDLNKTREEFKILNKENSENPIYFDSACMSLKPNQVVEAMNDYYYNFPACAGRSSHKLGDKVTEKIKETRDLIKKFINAKSEKEIIFTRNTTEGINLLSNGFSFQKGDVVLITDREHNSNLVPWLVLRDKIGIELRVLPSREDNTFDLEKYNEMVKGVKLVSMVYTSNLDGVTIPAKEIIDIAHKNGALVFLDAAQTIPHRKIDVKDLDVDFLAFSGHKMLGPTGTGVFYGKENLLEKLSPFLVGGDTVEYTTYTDYKMLELPEKFEAGLQDYAGIIGLGEAVKYLNNLDYTLIQKHEFELNKYITDEISKLPQIKIIGPLDPNLRSGIVNFYVENTDMHKFALMLDNMANISIRSGQHCVHSYFESRKIKNSARLSLYFYNTIAEAETFINNLNKIIKIIS